MTLNSHPSDKPIASQHAQDNASSSEDPNKDALTSHTSPEDDPTIDVDDACEIDEDFEDDDNFDDGEDFEDEEEDDDFDPFEDFDSFFPDDFDDEDENFAPLGQSYTFAHVKEGFKSGFVTLIGRPNAGKSTLLNAIMGKKIAITSSTAQTTRHRFRAILTRDDFQIILVDTPGLHKPHDALGEELNVSALKALEDVDVIACVIDASAPIGRGDQWVIEQLAALKAKKICVLSKTDKVDAQALASQQAAAMSLLSWDAMVGLSAQTGYNVEAFVEEVVFLLPPGPPWFPSDMETDQPIEVIVAEFIREKILRSFHDEVPHAIGVQVDHFDYNRKKDLHSTYATIYVERESQKGIIIGKKGRAIKTIGTKARADLEILLGTRVFLDLNVKVKKNWRRDENQIRRFGYGEGM